MDKTCYLEITSINWNAKCKPTSTCWRLAHFSFIIQLTYYQGYVNKNFYNMQIFLELHPVHCIYEAVGQSYLSHGSDMLT